MHSPTTMDINQNRTRRKTRRGRKKFIPLAVNVVNRETCEKDAEQRLVGCGCLGSPSKAGKTTSRKPKHESENMTRAKKRYLRPSVPPMAPHNSTQFIMNSYMDDLDLSLYLDNQMVTSSIIHDSSPDHDNNSNSIDSSIPCCGELDMEAFVLRDFETVFETNQNELESSPSQSLSPYSCSSDSTYSDSTPVNNNSINNSSAETTPTNHRLGSWLSATPAYGFLTDNERLSQNSLSPTEAFFEHMNREFQNELMKAKEEAVFNMSVQELRSSILGMEQRIEHLSKLEYLRRELKELKQENRRLKECQS